MPLAKAVQRKEARRSRLWFPLLIAAALGSGVYAGWRLSGLGPDEPTWDEELRLARLAGLPTTPEELALQIAIPDTENAARYFAKAFPYLENGTAEAKVIQSLAANDKYGLTATQRGELTKTLVYFEAPLKDVERGSRFSRIDFRRRWEAGTSVDVFEPSRLNLAVMAWNCGQSNARAGVNFQRRSKTFERYCGLQT